MHPFGKTNILLPQGVPMESWAVIACDQFVSQPEYWEEVRHLVGSTPSSLNLILPESELEGNYQNAIAQINDTMRSYLRENIFRLYPDSFIYVERTLLNGAVRKGVIGAVDLEAYDFSPDSGSAVRATEKTVPERLPPRMEIRRDAALELPHVLLLCDDEEKLLIESLSLKKDRLPLLYDFDLMLGGGRIRGWLVDSSNAAEFEAQIAAYESRLQNKYGQNTMLYAVGDGNHSLASAKGCYEENKTCRNARYALVELENIHDDAQCFEPIHRIVKNTDPETFLSAMAQSVGKPSGHPVHWYIGNRMGTVYVEDPEGMLPVGIIQDFLDQYTQSYPGTVDYIHGEDAVRQLAESEGTVGLVLPPVDKNAFFRGILAGSTLPRKTFSIGHAREKRYYLEAKEIK